jgi:hypothetical protein
MLNVSQNRWLSVGFLFRRSHGSAFRRGHGGPFQRGLSGTRCSVLATLALTVTAACGDNSEPNRNGASGPNPSAPGGAVFGAGSGQGGTSAGSGTFDGSLACVAQEASTERAPAVVQLVVDTSQSMNSDAPGSNRSKWEETRVALLGAIGELPATTAIGVVFYPDRENDPNRCLDTNVDVALAALGGTASNQRRQVELAFRNQSPDGGTPTHDAYRFALNELAKSPLPGARSVVLITDGTPTYSLGCEGTGLVQDAVDPAPLIPEAATALSGSVHTYVIGSPGSEGARSSLSRMAEAGGTARAGCSHNGPKYCHFDMTEEANFATSLRDALAEIAGLALSCNYVLPAPPGGATLDPNQVNVVFEPEGGETELLLRSPAGERCASGWQYASEGQQIALCSDTCDHVRSTGGSLTLQFGCVSRGVF